MGLFQRWIEHLRARKEAAERSASGVFRRAQDNIEPGALTVDGFLGSEPGRMALVIRQDEAEFVRLGLDWEAVATRLEELVDRGAEGLGESITVGEFLVKVDETRGRLPCPWEDGLFRKRSVTVQRLDRPEGPRLLYSDLSLHLLKDHHFLQGRGSPFRLEPETLAAVLGMASSQPAS